MSKANREWTQAWQGASAIRGRSNQRGESRGCASRIRRIEGFSKYSIVDASDSKGAGQVDDGSHTDYNDGFVPVAVNVDVLAGRAARDRKVAVYSAFEQLVEFDLDSIEFDNVNTWSNYVRGVIHFLQESAWHCAVRIW